MTFFDKFDRTSKVSAVDRYLASIIENLNNILNTKKDFGSILDEMGIRDLNEFRSQQDITSVVIEEVRKNIEQFEPRVELVDISPQPTESIFVLSFKIDCIVRKNAQSLQMVFDTFFSKFHINEYGD
ncbi:MAG: type VI secretion system baseplate subunit TssE [Syntrophobacterales bacterium]